MSDLVPNGIFRWSASKASLRVMLMDRRNEEFSRRTEGLDKNEAPPQAIR